MVADPGGGGEHAGIKIPGGDVATSATMKDPSFWATAGELLGFMWA